MKIATYNINSIKARCANLCQWLNTCKPDLVFLQEIKCETENFLYFECEALGYKTAVLGQKSYNGVAILSKYDFEITAKNLPNFQDDDAARYLEIHIKNKKESFYAISVYVPNGSATDSAAAEKKLAYKLKWLDCFLERSKELLKTGEPVVIGGDFNIMMEEIDVYDSSHFSGGPLYRKEVQDKIKALKYIGYHDSFRLLYPNKEGYTFWDYTANSFVTNLGLRIDYLFITAQLAERLLTCEVDKSLRSMERPSDHTALIAEFSDAYD